MYPRLCASLTESVVVPFILLQLGLEWYFFPLPLDAIYTLWPRSVPPCAAAPEFVLGCGAAFAAASAAAFSSAAFLWAAAASIAAWSSWTLSTALTLDSPLKFASTGVAVKRRLPFAGFAEARASMYVPGLRSVSYFVPGTALYCSLTLLPVLSVPSILTTRFPSVAVSQVPAFTVKESFETAVCFETLLVVVEGALDCVFGAEHAPQHTSRRTTIIAMLAFLCALKKGFLIFVHGSPPLASLFFDDTLCRFQVDAIAVGRHDDCSQLVGA